MKKLTRKGQMSSIQGFVMAIVTVGVVLAVGLIVLGELKDTQVTGAAHCNASSTTSCSSAYNSTNTIVEKLGGVPTWIGILITVALAFIVLSFFAGRRR